MFSEENYYIETANPYSNLLIFRLKSVQNNIQNTS